MTRDAKAVGEELQRLRRAARVTQWEIAEQLGLSVTFISLAEKGQRTFSEEQEAAFRRGLQSIAESRRAAVA